MDEEDRDQPSDSPTTTTKRNHTNKKRIYPKIHRCTVGDCNRIYTRLYTLKRHKRMHYNIRKYTCDDCGKKFTLHQYLKEHRLTHTGERPFICDHPNCHKTFRQAGKLSIHKQRHTTQLTSSTTTSTTPQKSPQNPSITSTTDQNTISPLLILSSSTANSEDTASISTRSTLSSRSYHHRRDGKKVADGRNGRKNRQKSALKNIFRVQSSSRDELLGHFVKSYVLPDFWDHAMLPVPVGMVGEFNPGGMIGDHVTGEIYLNSEESFVNHPAKVEKNAQLVTMDDTGHQYPLGYASGNMSGTDSDNMTVMLMNQFQLSSRRTPNADFEGVPGSNWSGFGIDTTTGKLVELPESESNQTSSIVSSTDDFSDQKSQSSGNMRKNQNTSSSSSDGERRRVGSTTSRDCKKSGSGKRGSYFDEG
mmetsp:Transcript_5570/g.6147  ORF Transcript_5570/g.6147 Transcript_5570/m.6147 type:complete len:419 (+) Transcript_5570:594-1850(+)